ncbi:MAG: tRNA dimethylallyltransferase [Chloroflexi bacterium]|nr:MAG: tRNA dimethylallyltransferase [Chloroflexota bacterium]MBA4374772.1 tRNA (adenosine(37)-N6)-dimethylallyltransferase MiaA [Anaerolinea sp.]
MHRLSNGSKMQYKKVVVIVGPTAVGKTDLAIRLAERIDGEIISADSRLLYRGMDIGTAKPGPDARGRVAHHMIDLADPDEVWSLAIYQKQVLEEIKAVQSLNRIPIVVGGTGQYIRSLTEGWVIPALQPDHKMREVIENWADEIGSVNLHRKLSIIDPDAADKIEANNIRRTVRALEVIFRTGVLFSTQQEKTPPPLNFKIIGLIRPREELYSRVDARIETMFDQGLVQEVKQLIEKGYTPDLPTLSAIGYREVMGVIQGACSLEEAKVMMRRKTRQFIRRQTNWFKPSDPNIEWFEMTPDPMDAVVNSIHEWSNIKNDK